MTEVTHSFKKPVSVMREENDVLVIEGVRFDGDYFRSLSDPNVDTLYALRKLDDGSVGFIQIHNLDEAQIFFEEFAKG